MPLLLVGLLAGGGLGFFAGGGTDGVGKIVKYSVIGGGLYLTAKHFKVI